jgi:predicted CoA-binding protein
VYAGSVMSSKPIAQKLQIKENYHVLLVNEPKDYRSMMGKLPTNVTVLTEAAKPVDFVQVFLTSRRELEAQLSKLKSVLKSQGLLWVTYPKGTSKVKTDINRDIIRQFAQKVGLQAVAMISIDETWSALRLKTV